jgi:hypothetical protein
LASKVSPGSEGVAEQPAFGVGHKPEQNFVFDEALEGKLQPCCVAFLKENSLIPWIVQIAVGFFVFTAIIDKGSPRLYPIFSKFKSYLVQDFRLLYVQTADFHEF